MSRQKKRNSSIELLRIICMLLIVAHHYSYYSGFPDISYENFNVQSVFTQLFGAFGQFSCAVFAVISGYYISAQDFDTSEQVYKHYKKVIPMIAQFMFYSIGIMLVLGCINRIDFTSENIIQSCLPVIYGNWYVRYYILFFLFVPFLNIMTSKLSEKMFTALVVMSFVIWAVVPYFVKGTFYFSCEDFFLVMYFIGAYLRRYMEKRLSTRIIIIGFVISILAYIATIVLYDLYGYYQMNDEYFTTAQSVMKYNQPLTAVAAVFTFLLFNRVSFYNYFINGLAASVMGVYLIHDNNLLKYAIWRDIFPDFNFAGSIYIHAILKVLLVFIVCIAIDMIRSRTIGRFVYGYYSKGLDKLYEKISIKNKPDDTEENTQGVEDYEN